jgi:hypothetical protein
MKTKAAQKTARVVVKAKRRHPTEPMSAEMGAALVRLITGIEKLGKRYRAAKAAKQPAHRTTAKKGE